jgi:2-polyprenyl-3-methyl-5-hydroxy-6-metoxy-1,4-benzoquinol methylase
LSSSSSDKIFGNDGGRLDVLKRNAFGRSALTEGFASGDTKTIERLLNHDSAEEERLIGGLSGKEVKTDEDDVDEKNVDGGEMEKKNASDDNIIKANNTKDGIVHEFDFLKDVNSMKHDDGDDEKSLYSNKQQRASVLIRELPIAHANDPFGQSPIEDTTGLGIWCASLVMSRWMASPDMVARMSNTTVLELGAGCGTPSLCAAIYGTPKSVTITDLNPVTINNAQYNIELNRLNNESCGGCSVTATSIDWGDETTYPTSLHGGKFDYVICSDCIYQRDIVDLLKKVVTDLLHPEHGTFLYVAPESGRDGLDEFIETMKSDSNFECVSEVIAPDSYRTNPLKNGDEEDCFLHFHELASKVYILYEFRQPAK